MNVFLEHHLEIHSTPTFHLIEKVLRYYSSHLVRLGILNMQCKISRFFLDSISFPLFLSCYLINLDFPFWILLYTFYSLTLIQFLKLPSPSLRPMTRDWSYSSKINIWIFFNVVERILLNKHVPVTHKVVINFKSYP